jgi:hypothetical protein
MCKHITFYATAFLKDNIRLFLLFYLIFYYNEKLKRRVRYSIKLLTFSTSSVRSKGLLMMASQP